MLLRPLHLWPLLLPPQLLQLLLPQFPQMLQPQLLQLLLPHMLHQRLQGE